MAASVTITADVEGRALEELARLIELRSRFIRDELTADAVTATALNVTTSLKAQAKVAPWKESARVPETAYRITETNLYGGFAGRDRKICCRVGSHFGAKSPISPVMAIRPTDRAALRARVYRVTLSNQHATFPQSVNGEKCWYVLAENVAAVKKLVTETRWKFVKRIFQKEGGLLRHSLTCAQAKICSKKGGGNDAKAAKMTAKIRTLGDNAAVIEKSGGGGKFAISVTNKLNYSASGLKDGEQSLAISLMKAANRTAGLINKIAGEKIGNKIPTPFPEIAGRSSKA